MGSLMYYGNQEKMRKYDQFVIKSRKSNFVFEDAWRLTQ